MVRCCQCASWLHVDCIAVKEEFVAGVWCCFVCRTMPSRIIQLQESVSTLLQTVHLLRGEITSVKHQHTKDFEVMQDTHSKIQEENKELLNRIKDLSSNTPIHVSSQEPKSHGTLLLGSSIIRDVDATKLVATKCVSISGGGIKDIHAALDKYPALHKFGNITLAVGGNDCDNLEQEGNDVTPLIEQYRELIESAKMRADTITISSVCPRNKPGPVSERIAALNAGLTTLCKDLDVTYVDNDDVFYLRDGSLNNGFLLPDNVHLTPAATSRLVTNLGLKLRQGCLSAHTDHRRRRSGNPPPPTHAEGVDDFSHTFWNSTWQKVKPHRNQRSPPSRNHHDTEQNTSCPGNTQPRDYSRSQGVTSRPPTPQNGYASRPPNPQNGYASVVRKHMPRKAPTTAHIPPTSKPPIPSLLRIATSPVHTSLPPHSQPRNPPQGDTCQLCLGAGHSAVTCRGREATCYNCKCQGHFARACPH